MRFYEALEGDLILPEYGVLSSVANLPNWLRPLLKCVLDECRGSLIASTRNGGQTLQHLMANVQQLRGNGIQFLLHTMMQ